MPHIIESKKNSKTSAADKDRDQSPKKDKFDEKRAFTALIPTIMKFTNFKVV